VILGVTSGQELFAQVSARLNRPIWRKALREMGLPESQVEEACRRISDHMPSFQENTFPGVLGNVVAGRIANRFDLGGTNCVIDAACASSLAALQLGLAELRAGAADMVLAGGADTFNDIGMYLCFSKTPALSLSGDCRPFSEDADGTMLGEGICLLALKRLADAERDQDRVYAIIKGIGSSSDGRAKSVYAPLPEGQARALRRAYEQADYSADSVELVEAHGTATRAGDLAEFTSLRSVFTGTEKRCALGSVKAQIGHTKAAAGAAGLFKAIMALHHKTLPPTIKVSRPNPDLGMEQSVFYLNTRPRPWVRPTSHPRRASVSSFGFGGSNFHVTLEEYTGPNRADRARLFPVEILPFAAASQSQLGELLQAEQASNEPLWKKARRLQADFRAESECRVVLLASSSVEFQARLQTALSLLPTAGDAPGVYFGSGPAPRMAWLFPGQGSQYLEMGKDLAMEFPQALAVWDRCADLCLEPGLRLDQVVFPPPTFDSQEAVEQEARLTQTQWAQPALGAAAVATAEVLKAFGLAPQFLAGHSFGELAALSVSGAYDTETLIRLARKRGELMAQAGRQVPGAMLSVPKALSEIEAEISEFALCVANHNAPDQVVLSGSLEAIEKARQRFSSATRLKVATAFHSPLMTPSVAPFREFLDTLDWAAIRTEIYCGATAAPYAKTTEAVKLGLAEQISSRVRFLETVQSMARDGAGLFLEVGPNSILTRLTRRCLSGTEAKVLATDHPGKCGLESLLAAIAQLAAAGLKVDFSPLWEGRMQPREVVESPHAIEIDGGNFGRAYPPAGGAAVLPLPNPEVAPAGVPEAPLPAVREVSNSSDFQAFQSALSESHAAFQKAMLDSQSQYMSVLERALGKGVEPQATSNGIASRVAVPVTSQASRTQEAPPHPEVPLNFQAPRLQKETRPIEVTPPESKTADGSVIEKELLLVVADKTGYPLEVLHADMDMEADLGIDSIKRVEILSAIRERVPGLPEVEPSLLGAARTLGEVAALFFAPTTGEGPPEDPGNGLENELLAVVADKTGYPLEVLHAEMDMEADLGIDSIKRVEILSAIRDRVPGLPEVDPALLSAARSLGDVAELLAPGGGTREVEASDLKSEPTTTAEFEQVENLELSRMVVTAVPSEPFGTGLIEGTSSWTIIPAHHPVAGELKKRLEKRGLSVELAEKTTTETESVLFLAGPQECIDAVQSLELHRQALDIARGAVDGFLHRGGSFVTVTDHAGAICRGWSGGLPGLVHTAAREWPKARLRAIDFETVGLGPEEIAARLDEELGQGEELEIMLTKEGARQTLHPLLAAPDPVESWVTSDDVVLASGGARGVTAVALEELARQVRPRIILLGRTPLGRDKPPAVRPDEKELKHRLFEEARAEGRTPTPAELSVEARRVTSQWEVQATLDRLEAAGAQVRYLSLDVRDAATLSEALEPIRREWGPITVLIHGAGVLADRHIRDKTDEQFEAVFSTKVGGLNALLEVTREDPLKAIVLFSSIVSRTGNRGQADYAMANEVLNRVAAAEARTRPDCRVRALAWGPWDGGMVDSGLRDHFQSQGVELIRPQAGRLAFVREVLGPLGGQELVLAPTSLGWKRRVTLDPVKHAFLFDHVVRDEPVLPVALVAQWFLSGLSGPGVLRDFKVLKGVVFKDGFRSSKHFEVRATPCPEGQRLELRSGHTVHYSALLSVGLDPPLELSSLSLEPSPWDCETVYDEGHLFHGPAFQVLQEIEGVSGEGIAGTLRSSRRQRFRTLDPTLLDGGLQLVRLWTLENLGKASLQSALFALGARKALELKNRWLTRKHLRCFDHQPSVGCYSEARSRISWGGKRHPHAVLLLHGFTSSPHSFRNLIPHLEEQGIPYYAPLLTGFGLDDFALLKAARTSDWRRDAWDAYQVLAAGAREVSIVSYSYGTVLASFIAQREPVRDLVMIGPYFFPKEDGDRRMKALLRHPLPAAIARFLKPVIAKKIRPGRPTVVDILEPEAAHSTFHYPAFPSSSLLRIWAEDALPDFSSLHCRRLTVAGGALECTSDVAAFCRLLDQQGVEYERWQYQKSGHGILLDFDQDQVCRDLLARLSESL